MLSRRSKRTKHAKPRAKAATVMTLEEQKWVEKATTSCTITIDGKTAISPALRKAIKKIPIITKLSIDVGENMRGEVVQCIANIMARIPAIETISFSGQKYSRYNGVKSAVGASHYKMLIKAIASASCLNLISVHYELPWEMEAAIIKGLKHRTSLTALQLERSGLIMNNAAIFAELLTSGKGLGRLELEHSECHDINSNQLRDGLRKCKSLKEVIICTNYQATIKNEDTVKCLLEGLRGNESLEKLELHGNHGIAGGPTGVSLLNQLVCNHEKLKSLRIDKDFFLDLEGFDAFCNSVICSRSITALFIGPDTERANSQLFTRHIRPIVSAVSRMLHQTASLQYLELPTFFYMEGMDEIVLGIKACKTLTKIQFMECFHLRTTLSLIDAVISNPNIIEIIDSGKVDVNSKGGHNNRRGEEVDEDESSDESSDDSSDESSDDSSDESSDDSSSDDSSDESSNDYRDIYRDNYHDDSDDIDEPESKLQSAQKELEFYVRFNKQGRSLVPNGITDGVWPLALAKAGRSLRPDALYFFFRECPQLAMNHSAC